MRLILRWAVFTGAAIVAAWFVLSWLQARDLGHAQALISGSHLSAGQALQASSLLDTEGQLNPDRTVDITRAQLAEAQHRPELAVRILEGVTQAEPLNLGAWRELVNAAAALPRSPERTRLAVEAFRKTLSLLGHPK